MRTAAGRVVLAAAITGFATALAGPAMAASGGAVPLARSAWFYTSVTNQVGAPAGLPVPEPTGVPAGDDAVAFTADQTGASSKETLLQFALPTAARSSTITAFTVTMSLDSSPTAPQAAAAKAPIVACIPTRGWSPGAAQDSSNQPTVDCSRAVAGVWKGNAVTFAIPRIAQSWVDDTNLGVALVNNPKNKTQPFQAVFAGSKQVKASLQYTPASTGTPKTHHHHSTTAGHHHPISTPSGGGGGAGAGNPPPLTNVNVPGGHSAASTGAGPAAQPPVVAGTGSATTTPADLSLAAAGRASSTPPIGFWAGGACLLILLVGAALALDEISPVTPTRSSRGRLDRLLRDPERLATFNARSQS